MNDLAKQLLTWAIIAIVLVSIFNHYANVGTTPDSLAYSEFLSDVRNGQVAQVHIQSDTSGNKISGRTVEGNDFQTFGPPDPKLVDDLVGNDVEITAEPPAAAARRSALCIPRERPRSRSRTGPVHWQCNPS